MVAWNPKIKEFRALGYNIALVTHDKPAALKRFADARNIDYTLLSDAKADIIPAFGIANPQFAKGSSWFGVALPVIFVVGKAGVIRHRFSLRNYQDRPEVDTILNVLRKDAQG